MKHLMKFNVLKNRELSKIIFFNPSTLTRLMNK